MNKTEHKQNIYRMIFVLITMLLWGSLYPMAKLAFSMYNVNDVPDIFLFAGIRFTICGMVIAVYALFKSPKSYAPAKSALIPILLSGLFSIILQYSFNYLGLLHIDSSKSAILKQVGVIFYVCFSALFFKNDRLTWRKLIGVILGFTGIIAINLSSDGISFHPGDLAIIAASFSTIFANIVSKKVFVLVDPITATGISQLFGGLVLSLVGIIMGGNITIAFDASIWCLVYICAASSISYCLWYWVVKFGELSKLFIFKFAEPLFASILGAIILHENIWQLQYLSSFILIAAGIWISNSTSRKNKKL